MRKIFAIAFAGVFVLPCLFDYASMEAKIEKTYDGIGNDCAQNESRPDSVSMDYDISSGTIVISSTAEKEKDITIEIYKGATKVYEDRDNISSGSSLNYTMTEDENGEYDVYVTVDGAESINQTIVK